MISTKTSFFNMSSRLKLTKDEFDVTVLLVGDTGTGKSSFGNQYLGEKVFIASDSPNPVTLEAIVKSKEVTIETKNEIKRGIKRVIDTEGFVSGNSITSEQIRNLAKLLKNYHRGINAIAIVINGRAPRFTQGVKDSLRFAYSAFGTKETLDHICIVFTNCDNPNHPNREQKRGEYMEYVKEYLSEISQVPIQNIPEIQIYFVDCYPEGYNKETEENLKFFHGWVLTRNALSTKNFDDKFGYHEKEEVELREHFLVGTKKIGNVTYELYEDQKRIKIIPNNKDPIRYSNWETIKKYKEPVKEEIKETRKNVDLGYKYSNDGKIRYKVTVDQERKIIRDLKQNINIEVSPWYNISKERRIEAGRRTVNEETRQRKFEKKVVEHQKKHSMAGFSSHPHTHYNIYHITRKEKRTVTTDYDGKKTHSNWLIIPGSRTEIRIRGGRELGWTKAYVKEIN